MAHIVLAPSYAHILYKKNFKSQQKSLAARSSSQLTTLHGSKYLLCYVIVCFLTREIVNNGSGRAHFTFQLQAGDFILINTRDSRLLIR